MSETQMEVDENEFEFEKTRHFKIRPYMVVDATGHDRHGLKREEKKLDLLVDSDEMINNRRQVTPELCKRAVENFREDLKNLAHYDEQYTDIAKARVIFKDDYMKGERADVEEGDN